MHTRLLYKKVLYVFLSLMIVFANTQTAFAASGWSVTNAVSFGSRVIVSASKAGYKSAVNMSPSVGRLAGTVLKRGNQAYLIYAISGLIGDGVDYVLDPANNQVKYKVIPNDSDKRWSTSRTTRDYVTREEACSADAAALDAITGQGWRFLKLIGTSACQQYIPATPSVTTVNSLIGSLPPILDKVLTAEKVASKVIKNATANHAPSQALVRGVVTEMVATGDFDADLLSGAVPTNDSRPLIPSVPISGSGNVSYGSGSGTGTGEDGTMTGGDLGAATDDAIAAADDAKKAAEAARDAAEKSAEDARRAADDAVDVINSAVDQAIKDAAKAAADAAAKSAADAKAVADAAAEKSAEAARDAARDAANAKAAADKALADAKKAAADAAEADKAAADAAVRAAEAEAAKAKERADAAEKAAEKAKAEAAKPFELPAFCTWASVVCDYTVWVKEEYGKAKAWVKEEPTPSPAELMPIDEQGMDINIFKDKAEAGYVSFESQCPSDVLIPVDLMGASQVLNISYTPFCHFASLIRPAVILGAWISGLLIISGGRGRE